MRHTIEQFIRKIFRQYKAGEPYPLDTHPAEEEMACFLEDRLSPAESEEVKKHIIHCSSCGEYLGAYLQMKEEQGGQPPAAVIRYAKGLVSGSEAPGMLDVLIRIKQHALELLRTTGDVIVGQEVVSPSLLRSRSLKDFKDEVVILKDFGDIRLELKIEHRGPRAFDLGIRITEKQTLRAIRDVRVTLVREALELESRIVDSGTVTFEHVVFGRYTVEVARPEKKLASVSLDIKA